MSRTRVDDGMWDVALRYAGEFSGFRVAAAVSYGKNAGNTTDAEDNASTATLPSFGDGADLRKWQGSASVLHVATGLFLTGAYVNQSYNGTSGELKFDAIAGANRPDTEMWYLLGGITRNWTGLGNTALYGEYGRFEGGADGLLVRRASSSSNTEVSFWGIGVVQHIDAAAMEVYLSYRNFANSFVDDAGLGTQFNNDDLERRDGRRAGQVLICSTSHETPEEPPSGGSSAFVTCFQR